MPQCHLCKHNGKGRRECLECADTLDQPYNHGQTHVGIHTPVGNGRRTVGDKIAQPTQDEGSGFAPNIDECCWDVADKIIGTFLALSDDDRNLVCHLLKNGTAADYGRTIGLTKQGASYRLIQIARKHPVFAFFTMSKGARLDRSATGHESQGIPDYPRQAQLSQARR